MDYDDYGRPKSLEARVEELESKLDKKVDMGHSHLWMSSAICKLQDEWILFRLIRESIGIVLILGIIALVVSWW